MPSQPSAFSPIPFSTTSPPQNFRLLELPPELVEIIESQRRDAKKMRKLWFKSSPARTVGNGEDADREMGGMGDAESGKEGFLHLCTEDRVWGMKQVSTSNSVYVARTISAEEAGNERDGRRVENENGDAEMLEPEDQDASSDNHPSPAIPPQPEVTVSATGITRIAQVKSILELISIPSPTKDSIETQLRALVPIFADNETEGTLHSGTNPPPISMNYLFSNIPAPLDIVTEAARRLFVFENKDPSNAAEDDEQGRGDQSPSFTAKANIPSNSLLLKCWTSFTSQCDISGLKLDRKDGIESSELMTTFREMSDATSDPSEGALIQNVTLAILRHVATQATNETHWIRDTLHADQRDHDYDHNPNLKLILDPSLTAETIGTFLILLPLRVFGSPLSDLHLSVDETISTQSFLAGWRKLLPDSWAGVCDVETLISGVEEWEIVTDRLGEEVIRREAVGRYGKERLEKKERPLVVKGKGKAKWHEKFGKQRSEAAAATARSRKG